MASSGPVSVSDALGGLFGATGPVDPFEAEAAAAQSVHLWGVDCSTQRVSVACAGPAGVEVATRSFDRHLAGGERLAGIYFQTFEFARGLDWPLPARVYVEELVVFPGRTSPILYQATGVIQAALFAAVGVPVVAIPPARWKMLALGAGCGGAKKPQILEWARSVQGYGGALEDEADAIGTAVAGRSLVFPVQQALGV